MRFPDSFKLSTPGDREILVTRDFDAPRSMLFDAFTRPELVRRWLLGPPGWTMPICEIDLRIGGAYRYAWRSETDGSRMAVGGVFRDIIANKRLVATEKFDDAWYPGEAVTTTEFTEAKGVTTVSISILYESQEARDTARRSGMEHGLSAGLDRLEDIIETPDVVELAAQHVAAIHIETSRAGIRDVMGPGIQEAMAAAKAQGIGPTGPWFAHHLRITPGEFVFDICVPVSAPVKAVGRVTPGERPAMKAVSTVYRGPYEGLGAAWQEFDRRTQALGHKTAADVYERYLVGPETSQDPEDWRTELSRRIIAD